MRHFPILVQLAQPPGHQRHRLCIDKKQMLALQDGTSYDRHSRRGRRNCTLEFVTFWEGRSHSRAENNEQ